MLPGTCPNPGATAVIGGGGGGATDPSVLFGDAQKDTATRTTYTETLQFNTQTDRDLCVVEFYGTSTGNRTLVSATIDGIAATIDAQQTVNSSTDPVCGIISATGVTGTSAVVALTFSGSLHRCGMASHSLYDLDSTSVVSTNSTTSDGGALDLNTQVGTICIAVHGQVGDPGPTTPTGVTEDHYTPIEGTVDFASGSHKATTAETPRAIKFVFSSGTFHNGCSASYR